MLAMHRSKDPHISSIYLTNLLELEEFDVKFILWKLTKKLTVLRLVD